MVNSAIRKEIHITNKIHGTRDSALGMGNIDLHYTNKHTKVPTLNQVKYQKYDKIDSRIYKIKKKCMLCYVCYKNKMFFFTVHLHMLCFCIQNKHKFEQNIMFTQYGLYWFNHNILYSSICRNYITLNAYIFSLKSSNIKMIFCQIGLNVYFTITCIQMWSA